MWGGKIGDILSEKIDMKIWLNKLALKQTKNIVNKRIIWKKFE